jgi:hypothetical protein
VASLITLPRITERKCVTSLFTPDGVIQVRWNSARGLSVSENEKNLCPLGQLRHHLKRMCSRSLTGSKHECLVKAIYTYTLRERDFHVRTDLFRKQLYKQTYPPPPCISKMYCKREIYRWHCAISRYQTNGLSSVNTLHGRKL